MAGYTPLFNSIVTSSVWNEDSETRIVWITLLALADANGRVEGSVSGLAPVARVSLAACEKALHKLKQPDAYSRTKEYEGRRMSGRIHRFFAIQILSGAGWCGLAQERQIFSEKGFDFQRRFG